MSMPLSRVAAVVSALCLLGVAACTGEGDAPAPTRSAEPTPAQRLATAKATLDAAPSVHVALTSSGVPKGSSGIVSADGWGKHPPAFKGTFQVSLRGVQADAEVISVGGEVYAKLPLVPGMNRIDPKRFGLPDPALLFSPDRGLTTLLTKTTNPTAGDDVRNGSEVLSTIRGTVPGANVVDLFGIGDRTGTFGAVYGLTSDQQLRTVALDGPFFGAGSRSTYSLKLDRYGEAVTIEKP